MDHHSLSRSVSDIRNELTSITRDQNTSRDKIKRKAIDCTVANIHILNTGRHFALDPFGAGMSSKAIDATNTERADLQSQLHSGAIDPAQTAIIDTRNILRDM